jgi:hypothetical protein
MKTTTSILFIFCYFLSFSQNFIDTIYNITTVQNVQYGTAVNFAGQDIDLLMDISYPENDLVPACGRPLIVIVHGGAWLGGSKNDGYIAMLRNHFAKRGYVAAAINYRLGFFQTNIAKNCNVDGWNCMNAADSAEWTRALYRGIQDTKGSIRHLIINQSTYSIDASNVYVVGESAGAFIAMGVGYMDSPTEKPLDCGTISPVNAPHQNYYTSCIQGSSFDIPIASMTLNRPDLGTIEGSLNPTNLPFVIKGIGSLYGGIYDDLFSENASPSTPVLYMFHQPNDLIVPIGYNKLLKGFNDCAVATGCVTIQDRRMVYGNQAIANMIDTLNIPVNNKPNYLYQTTSNSAGCLEQVLNPSTGGHQLDNFWIRSTAMATHFAPNIGSNDCQELGTTINAAIEKIHIYPNPFDEFLTIESSKAEELTLFNAQGKKVNDWSLPKGTSVISTTHLEKGIYFLNVHSKEGNVTYKILK